MGVERLYLFADGVCESRGADDCGVIPAKDVYNGVLMGDMEEEELMRVEEEDVLYFGDG